MSTGDLIAALLMLAFGLAAYFCPFFMATWRKHSSTAGIFVVNVFLGWTFIGWVVALAWAMSGPDNRQRATERPTSALPPTSLEDQIEAAQRRLDQESEARGGGFKVIPSKVRGVTHANPDGSDRQRLIRGGCVPGMTLRLVREPDNPYDSNATHVCLPTGEQIGFVGARLAEDIAPALDRGDRIEASVSEITGGTDDKEARGVNIEFRWFENF